MEHELKVLKPYYSRLVEGSKTCEVRRDDRDFQIGDTLKLRCYSKESLCFIEPYEPLYFLITHILKGEQFGIKDGFAVLSIKKP